MAKPPRSRIEGLGFDWLFVVISGISMLGVYVDGWAHNHLDDIDTFWTPWHGLIYVGAVLVLILTVVVFLWNRLPGVPWTKALPVGYGISAIGVLIYGLSGAVDFVNHTFFAGFEARIEALLSPPHIGLLVGATLFRTGPLRAAWHRRGASGWGLFAAVVSATYLLSSFTFFTQYVHPFGLTAAAAGYRPPDGLSDILVGGTRAPEYVVAVGVASVLLQAALLMGIVLLLVWRWGSALPVGTITLVLTVNAVGMTWMRDRYLSTGPVWLILVALVAGIVGDALLRWLRPSTVRVMAFRWFAFLLPLVLYLLYFVTVLLFGGGLWWTPLMWLGLIAMAGGTGWLVGLLVEQPT